jgi:glucose 1-dehydrogenase
MRGGRVAQCLHYEYRIHGPVTSHGCNPPGIDGIWGSFVYAREAAGARVAVNYVTAKEQADQVVAEITAAGGQAMTVFADVSKEDQVQAMFRSVIAAYGSLDIMVANAGLQRDAAFHDMTLAQWQLVVDINLTGQFLCAREAIREFLRRGMAPELSSALGKIICMSSVHQIIPWGGHANYAASKGGVGMLMETLAQEYGPKHIRVNSINPGAIKTPINRAAWETPEAERRLLTLIPYGRAGVVADIAKAAVWLASDDSDYVTGHALYVDGGMTLYPGFSDNG